MSSAKTALIIGNSHTECLIEANKLHKYENLYFLNLRSIGKCQNEEELEKIVSLLPIQSPDKLCVCVRGNIHNSVGMYEHDIPISLGARDGAVPPADSDRLFVPYAVLYENICFTYNFETVKQLFDYFPATDKFYMMPPPPVALPADNEVDLDSFIDRVKAAFEKRREFGISSEELRMAFYRAECDAVRANIGKSVVSFIEPPGNTLNEQGLLKREFYNPNDPMHGNTSYGLLMLDKIMKKFECLL